MLEQLHDDEMNFTTDRAFQPLPIEWRRTSDLDDTLEANAADSESEEDDKSA